MKGSKGLYVFTVTDFEDTDSLHIEIGGEEAYIPMRDIYGAAENHKKYLAAKAKIDAMPEEERMEKAESKLEQQLRKFSVLADDVRYLLIRIQEGNLASSAEMYEVQEEIHDMQRILADSDAYVSKEIAKLTAERAISGMLTRIKLQSGLR